MNKRFSALQGRSLAIGLLLFVLLAGVAAIAVPLYLMHRYYDRQLEDLDDRLTTYRRVAASREAFGRQLTQLRALDGRRLYLRDSAPALLAGDVQETVKSLIEANGGRLVSMQILPHKDEGGFRRVAVSARIMGGLASIQDILLALESGEPSLFLENLSMHAQSDGPAAGSSADELIVQFDAIGYAIPGAAR